MSRKKARRTRQQPTPIRRALPSEPPAWRTERRKDTLRGWAGVLAMFGIAVLFYTSDHVAGAYVDLARWITGGQPWGMAISGWLILFAPFAVIGALALIWPREAGKKWRYPLLGLLGALTPVALSLVPVGEGFDLAYLVSGTGGTDFIIGLRNGGLAGIVPLVVVPFVVRVKRIREAIGTENLWITPGLPVAAWALMTLVAAVALAQA